MAFESFLETNVKLNFKHKIRALPHQSSVLNNYQFINFSVRHKKIHFIIHTILFSQKYQSQTQLLAYCLVNTNQKVKFVNLKNLRGNCFVLVVTINICYSLPDLSSQIRKARQETNYQDHQSCSVWSYICSTQQYSPHECHGIPAILSARLQ